MFLFQWQSEQNHPEGHQLHWDHALLLTGLDLKVLTGNEGKFPKYSPKIVGLSPVSGMCNPATSCTVSEGNHFESVFVIAHEIGHSLGKKTKYCFQSCSSPHFIVSGIFKPEFSRIYFWERP